MGMKMKMKTKKRRQLVLLLLKKIKTRMNQLQQDVQQDVSQQRLVVQARIAKKHDMNYMLMHVNQQQQKKSECNILTFNDLVDKGYKTKVASAKRTRVACVWKRDACRPKVKRKTNLRANTPEKFGKEEATVLK